MWKVREREESRMILLVLMEQLGGQWLWIEIKEFCLGPVKFEATSRHPGKDVQESTWICKFGVQDW